MCSNLSEFQVALVVISIKVFFFVFIHTKQNLKCMQVHDQLCRYCQFLLMFKVMCIEKIIMIHDSNVVFYAVRIITNLFINRDYTNTIDWYNWLISKLVCHLKNASASKFFWMFWVQWTIYLIHCSYDVIYGKNIIKKRIRSK